MKSKEYYESLLRVFDYLTKHRSIDCNTATELAQKHWPAIVQAFHDAGAGQISAGGDFYMTQGQYLNTLAAEAEEALAQFEQMDEDRRLDALYKEENIKYGRRGFYISLFALLLSAIAIVIEMIRWLQG